MHLSVENVCVRAWSQWVGGYPEGQVHVDLKERGKGGDLKWFHPVWRSKTLRKSESTHIKCVLGTV